MRRIEIVTALAVDALESSALNADLDVVAAAILRRSCFDEDVATGIASTLSASILTRAHLQTLRPLLAACHHDLTPSLVSALRLQVSHEEEQTSLTTFDLKIDFVKLQKTVENRFLVLEDKKAEKRCTLAHEILEMEPEKRQHFDSLKSKMVDLIDATLPGNTECYTAILETAYPHFSLTSFVLQELETKRQRLKNIVHTVIGIYSYQESEAKGLSLEELEAALESAKRKEKHCHVPTDCINCMSNSAFCIKGQLTVQVSRLHLYQSKEMALEKVHVLLEDEECGAPLDASYYFELLGSLKMQEEHLRGEYLQTNFQLECLTQLTMGQTWMIPHDVLTPLTHPPTEILVSCLQMIIKEAESVDDKVAGVSGEFFEKEQAWGGFCPVTLVQTEGMLNLADPSVDTHIYGDKIIGFCSPSCRETFLNETSHIIQASLRLQASPMPPVGFEEAITQGATPSVSHGSVRS